MAVVLKCAKHPRYVAARRPSVECATCWTIARAAQAGTADMRVYRPKPWQVARLAADWRRS